MRLNDGLMQAGVPIKAMVGGIAMGLLMNKNGDFKILSDISVALKMLLA